MERMPLPENVVTEEPILDEEKSFEFEENGQKGRWLTIEKDGRKVEGSFYKNENSNGETIIYIPGAPGDGVVSFEEKHLPVLLDAGYDVFVSRHGGIKHLPENKDLFHNEARFSLDGGIGDDAMTVNGWVREPEIILDYFSKTPVTCITHSFGGLALAHTLAEADIEGESDSKYENLERWVNLSGVNYSLEDYKKNYAGLWRWYFENVLSKRCNVEDIEKELLDLETAIKEGTEGLKGKMAEKISVISVNPKEDEYVGPEAGLELQSNVGRGLVLNDKTIAKADINESQAIHDYPHLTSDLLRRLVKVKTSKFKHSSTLQRNDAIAQTEVDQTGVEQPSEEKNNQGQ